MQYTLVVHMDDHSEHEMDSAIDGQTGRNMVKAICEDKGFWALEEEIKGLVWIPYHRIYKIQLKED